MSIWTDWALGQPSLSSDGAPNAVTALEALMRRGLLECIDVTDPAYDAPTDMVADASAEIQGAHDALPAEGGVLRIHQHRTASKLNLTKPVAIIGGGRRYFGATAPSRIVNDASDVFGLDGGAGSLFGLLFAGFNVQASAGHIFDLVAGNATQGFGGCTWHRLGLYQTNTGKSVFNMGDQVFIDNIIDDVWSAVTGAHTVPAWYLASSVNGGISRNTWRNMRTQHSGAAAFHFLLRCLSAASWCADNTFEKINFEEPNGGCIYLQSCDGTVIDTCAPADLTAGSPATQDMFVVDKYSAGPASKNTTFRNVRDRVGGATGLGAHKMYKLIATAGTTFRDCDGSLDVGSQLGTSIDQESCQGLTITNEPVFTVATAAHAGTSAAVSRVSGGDRGGVITHTAGTGPTAGDIYTVTFATPLTRAPKAVVVNGWGPMAAKGPYVSAMTTTGFTVAVATGLDAGPGWLLTFAVIL